jgi:hypothetical protein
MEQGEEEREKGKRVAVCVGGRFGRVPASAIPPFGARAAVLIQEFSTCTHLILCDSTTSYYTLVLS